MTTAEDLGIEELDQVEVLDTDGSSVFRATQSGTGREVAVKILDPYQEPLIPRRFDLRRKPVTKFAEEPGVVAVHEVGTTSRGQQYLILPYYPLGSLADQIKQGALPWRQATDLVRATAAIVSVGHDLGLVLGDIKPSSVLLSDGTTPNLAVYGMATRRFDDGRPSYAAPEVKPGDPATATADVFSLSMILAALIVGADPGRGRPPSEILQGIDPETPPWLIDVLRRGLHRSPNARHASAGALAEALVDGLGSATAEAVDDDEAAVDLDQLLGETGDGTASGDNLSLRGVDVDPPTDREPDDPFDFEALLELPTQARTRGGSPSVPPIDDVLDLEEVLGAGGAADLLDTLDDHAEIDTVEDPEGSVPDSSSGAEPLGPVPSSARPEPASGEASTLEPQLDEPAVPDDHSQPGKPPVRTNQPEPDNRPVSNSQTESAPAPGDLFQPGKPPVSTNQSQPGKPPVSTNQSQPGKPPVSTSQPQPGNPPAPTDSQLQPGNPPAPSDSQPQPGSNEPAVRATQPPMPSEAGQTSPKPPPDTPQRAVEPIEVIVLHEDETLVLDRPLVPPTPTDDTAAPAAPPTEAASQQDSPTAPLATPGHGQPPQDAAAARAASILESASSGEQRGPDPAAASDAANQGPTAQHPPSGAVGQPHASVPGQHDIPSAQPVRDPGRPAAEDPFRAGPTLIGGSGFSQADGGVPPTSIWDTPPQPDPGLPPDSTIEVPITQIGPDEATLFSPGEARHGRVRDNRTSPLQSDDLLGQGRPMGLDNPAAFPTNFERRRDVTQVSGMRRFLDGVGAFWVDRRPGFTGLLAVLAFAAIAVTVGAVALEDLRPTSPTNATEDPTSTSTEVTVAADQAVAEDDGQVQVEPTALAPVLPEPASTHVTRAARGTARRLTTTVATTLPPTTAPTTAGPGAGSATTSTAEGDETTTETTVPEESSTTAAEEEPEEAAGEVLPPLGPSTQSTQAPTPEGPTEPVSLIRSSSVSRVGPTSARISFDSTECVTALFTFGPAGGATSQVSGGPTCAGAHTLLLGTVTPGLTPNTDYVVVVIASNGSVADRQVLRFTTTG